MLGLSSAVALRSYYCLRRSHPPCWTLTSRLEGRSCAKPKARVGLCSACRRVLAVAVYILSDLRVKNLGE